LIFGVEMSVSNIDTMNLSTRIAALALMAGLAYFISGVVGVLVVLGVGAVGLVAAPYLRSSD
jgi:hypothetical protein